MILNWKEVDMECSCCGKEIKNNMVIQIALSKNVPDLLICKNCIDEMHSFLEDRANERKEYISKQKKEIIEEVTHITDQLSLLYNKYIDTINDNYKSDVSYSNAKYVLNKLNTFYCDDSVFADEAIVNMFNSILGSCIDYIYKEEDYNDLTRNKFKKELDSIFVDQITELDEQIKNNNLVITDEDIEEAELDDDYDTDENHYEDFTVLKDEFDTPSKIKAELDKYVIGQEKAKKIISVGIYNHYKRIEQNKTNIKKSNILLTGPTGCGKTEIARTIANMLNVPFAIADATSLTSAGYVGDDVEDMLLKLIDDADGDIDLAEYGIIYIDEIDKLARNGNVIGKDVGGEGVQQALLKIVEGNEITINTKSGTNPFSEPITINTENILFIAGGAFESLTMEDKPAKVSLGFSVSSDENKEENKEDNKNIIDAKALIKYGIIPELTGRFPIIATLHALTQNDLKRILVEPENSIVKQYQELFSIDDVKLKFNNEALDWIAKKAFDNKTGARGLKSIIEDSMLEVMYELPDASTINQVQVSVKNNALEFKKTKKKERKTQNEKKVTKRATN